MRIKKNERARRRLKPEEEQLWQTATALVRPLPDEVRQINLSNEATTPSFFSYAQSFSNENEIDLAFTFRHRSAATKARRRNRGRPRIDARLDLHGKSQAQAYDSLKAAVALEKAKGSSVLLVITGKGSGDDNLMGSSGVLRRLAPLWLSTFPEVANLEQAHRRDGGDGAFYVYIDKQAKGDE